MTLIKSLLLGSAAGIVAVATAQAADLPTRKAAPVEYVRVCNVGGITGWTLPGSDTCVKFSGYVTAHFIGGNLSNQYNSAGAIASAIDTAVDPFAAAHLSQVLMVQGGDHAVGSLQWRGRPDHSCPSGARHRSRSCDSASSLPNQKNAIFNRDAIGWNVRANFGFDLASNTAYGPLIGHFDLNSDVGNGFDSPSGSATYVNTGYVTWAGITAGKAQSFFSFIGGGDNWNNFFSPDRKGFNEPNLLSLHRLVRRRLHGDVVGGKPGHSGLLRRRHQHDRRLRVGRQRPSRHRSHDLWRSALARHRRRAACQAGMGRGPGLRRDPQRQRQGLRLLPTLSAAGSLRSSPSATRRRARSAGPSTRA